ncbi:hypothetical protein CPT_Moby_227 [Stenotrophomonas phage Moby]|uniref:Carboxypeptidase regulatory-like domain-containing protein n=1 Tax=Stenotrophomonas phage Moby TaxID=2601680 RepID=A0A5P8PMP7_9CAUD|nr:hypothetical protein HWC58_gp171 [Stenotrophomonas phage Moby]QFR57952.1 hypothetical protein CPT_Moby_227 [Stenotrophomonas phage Moby]
MPDTVLIPKIYFGTNATPVFGRFLPSHQMNGSKTISGRVSEGTVPKGGYQMFLLIHGSQIPIAQTTTSSIGEYSFTGLRDDVMYDVLAFDPVSKWEAKVSSKRIAG